MKVEESSFYRVKIRELPFDDRPREKLMSVGPERLSEADLLAILIRTGSQTQSALELSQIIVSRFGNLQTLATMDYQEFLPLKGMGNVKAVTLSATFEIARRIASTPFQQKFSVSSPEVVFQRYSPLFGHLQKEVFTVLILNSANHLIKTTQVSEGILNAALVHPREVFKAAILASAASIIMIHNHPSGVAAPSLEDKKITEKLVSAGNLLDIPVLDHIIITEQHYFSFKEAGLISE